MAVVGRQAEIEQLDRFLDRVESGAAGCVLEGETGIGKSTLWDEAVGRARERSFRVLSARAAESEIKLAYVTVGDLLADVDREVLSALPAPQRTALDVALLKVEPKGPLGRRAVAMAVLAVLEAIGSKSPVLVAIDETQWLDAASAVVLEFVARRSGSWRIGMLLCQRSAVRPPFDYDRTFGGGLVRVSVGGMSLAALHVLIKQRLGNSLSRRALLEVARISAGNPLFAIELARVLASPTSDDDGALPTTLEAAVSSRLRALPKKTREALLLAAAAAEPSADLFPARALEAAIRADVVRLEPRGDVRFAHPLYAWVIYRQASASERRGAHLLLADRPSSDQEGIRHRALAATGWDEGLAAELELAAATAQRRGAPAAAADLLDHARRLTPVTDTDAWGRRARLTIPLLVEAGDWDAAWALGQEALERLPRGPVRAGVLLEAAFARPGTLELCRQALDEAGDDDVLRLRAELLIAQQLSYTLDVVAVFEHIDAAVELARRLGNPMLLALALTYRGILRLTGGVGDPAVDLDEALRLEEAMGERAMPLGISAAAFRALWSGMLDRVNDAAERLEGLSRAAIEHGDESSEAMLESFVGMVRWRAGDWAAARQSLERAIALADQIGFAQAQGLHRGWLASVTAQQGDIERTEALLAEAGQIADALDDGFARLAVLAARALLALSQDDPLGALGAIHEIRRLRPAGADLPLWLAVDGDEIEALIATGRTGEAATRIAALDRRANELGWSRAAIWAERGHTLLLARDRDLQAALEVAGRLVSQAERMPFELARSLLLLGQLQRRAKQRAAAKVTLLRARAIFENLGARLWHAKTEAEIGRLGLRHAGRGLTDSERRVAELAGLGATNREIAARLFMSTRTVETNLARAYRKLDIRSRAELGAVMAGGGAKHVETTDSSHLDPP